MCREFENEAKLFVDELGDQNSGLHRDPSDGEGVGHDRQHTCAPDSKFAGKSEGSVA